MAMLENKQTQRAKKARHLTRLEAGGHDALHLFPPGHPLHRDYLKHCWCMCQKCFRTYQTRGKSDKVIGRCICPACPCNRII